MGRLHFRNASIKVALLFSAIALLSACAGSPEFVIKTAESDGLVTNPNSDPNSPLACERTGPLEESFQIQPSSIRGANVVFAIDDSGSMGDNIGNLSSNLNSFLSALAQNAQDNFRVVLLFRMNGFQYGNNGTAFNPGAANPFQSHIDNQRVFYVPEGTGSRGIDVALFRAFSLPSFSQDILSSWPVDGGGQLQSACSGAGKYFRPRVSSDSSSLDQVQTSCFASPGLSNLSHLLPGIAINIVAMTDDDLNVSGGFPGDGLQNVKNMLSQVFRPLGNTTPLYYHSFAGTSTTPPNPFGSIERVGANHLALSDATQGLKADIRSSSYADVLNQIRTRILFSEQVVGTSCQSDSHYPIEVLKDGVVLNSSQYSFNLGTRELRLLPSAFTDADINATIDILVRY